MLYAIHLEETGQTFPIPEKVGKTDEDVRRGLAGTIPYITTAALKREETDGTIKITVTKSHASKGGGGNSTPFVSE